MNFDKDISINNYHPARMSKNVVTTDKQHLVSFPSVDNPSGTELSNLYCQVDESILGYIPMTPSNYRIMQITMGTNPNTNKRALVLSWYADGSVLKSYIDVIYETSL